MAFLFGRAGVRALVQRYCNPSIVPRGVRKAAYDEDDAIFLLRSGLPRQCGTGGPGPTTVTQNAQRMGRTVRRVVRCRVPFLVAGFRRVFVCGTAFFTIGIAI